jgi:hypothetical protein
MNLHICGLENEQEGYAEILWRLNIGSGICDTDGYSVVRDGRVETPQLCEDTYIELRPDAIREIHTRCQEWWDEKPERDKKNQEWEDRYEEVKGEWERWEEEPGNKTRVAIPSVDYFPSDRAASGPCSFRVQLWDDAGDDYYYFVKRDPTWGEVLRFFDKSIRLTGDEHHCYLEGIIEVGELDGVTIYEFCTGS